MILRGVRIQYRKSREYNSKVLNLAKQRQKKTQKIDRGACHEKQTSGQIEQAVVERHLNLPKDLQRYDIFTQPETYPVLEYGEGLSC